MKDAELAVRTGLADGFPDAHVSTEAPAEIVGPTIRTVRSSGGSTWKTLDRPLFDVDCFDLTRDGARELAEQVRDWFNDAAHTTVDGLAVTRVDVVMGPRWLPWDNTDVRRFGATYQLYAA